MMTQDIFGNKTQYIIKAIMGEQKNPNSIDDHKIDEILQSIFNCDPVAKKTNGKKSPFAFQIVHWMNNKTIILPEDEDGIYETLQRYNNCLQLGSVPPITDFQSPGEVNKCLDTLFGQNNEKPQKFDYLTVYSVVGDYIIYQVDTWEQAEKAFADSGWCVKNNSFFENYKAPYHMVVKDDKRVALFHRGSGQAKDTYNDTVSNKDKGIIECIKTVWPKFTYQGDISNFDKYYENIIEDIKENPSDVVEYISRNLKKKNHDHLTQYFYHDGEALYKYMNDVRKWTFDG